MSTQTCRMALVVADCLAMLMIVLSVWLYRLGTAPHTKLRAEYIALGLGLWCFGISIWASLEAKIRLDHIMHLVAHLSLLIGPAILLGFALIENVILWRGPVSYPETVLVGALILPFQVIASGAIALIIAIQSERSSN